MANVCSRCSTDNADGALVCRQCGASLAAHPGWSRSLVPDDDNFDPLSAPTLVMRHTVPSELPPLDSILIPPETEPSRFGPRLVLGLAAFAVLLGGGVWLLRPSGEAPAPVASPAPPAAMQAASTTASPATESSVPQAASAAPLVPAVPASAAVAGPTLAAASAAASAVERRRRIPEPVSRKQAMEAASAAPPAIEPEVVAPAPQPPAAPAPEPVKPKTVTELCSSGNLLTRGFCEHRECGKGEHSADPVCVRIREAEEARRFRQ